MKIDLSRAFTYVTEDPRWLTKLLLMAVYFFLAQLLISVPLLWVLLAIIPPDVMEQVTALYPQLEGFSVTITPSFYLLIVPFAGGTIGAMLLMGYYIELVKRVRIGEAFPLPEWNNYVAMIRMGSGMFFGYLGYILFGIGIYAIGTLILQAMVGYIPDMALLFLAFCFNVPLLLFFGFGMIFLTSICVLPYSESGYIRDYYNLGWVWYRMRHNGKLTAAWFFNGILANFGFSLLQAIPLVGLLGLLLTLTMTIPVQGHLLGQYAIALDNRYKKLTYGEM